MRELTVFYCPVCGRYGYYQLIRNAVCASCGQKMQPLHTPYIKFIRLNRTERDQVIIEEILKYGPSVTGRILAADRAHEEQQPAARLLTRIRDLEDENKKLNDVIEWMHQTIWDLLTRSKELERRLAQLQPEASGETDAAAPMQAPEPHG